MIYAIAVSVINFLFAMMIVWVIQKNKKEIIDFLLKHDPVKYIDRKLKKDE